MSEGHASLVGEQPFAPAATAAAYVHYVADVVHVGVVDDVTALGCGGVVLDGRVAELEAPVA